MPKSNNTQSTANTGWNTLAKASLPGAVLNSFTPSSASVMSSFKIKNDEADQAMKLTHCILDSSARTAIKFGSKFGFVFKASGPMKAIESGQHIHRRYHENIASGLSPVSSSICTTLATAGHIGTAVAGSGLTMSVAYPLLVSQQYYQAALIGLGGFEATRIASRLAGDAIQDVCQLAVIQGPELITNSRNVVNKKLSDWHLSTALKQLDSKEAKKASDKHQIPTVITNIIKDAIIEKNVELGSEIFSGNRIAQLDRPVTLPVTHYLVKMGSRCNRSAEADLRAAGAHDIADLCSKDSFKPEDEIKKASVDIAITHLTIAERLNTHFKQLPHIQNDIEIVKHHIKTESVATANALLFARSARIDTIGLSSSTSVARALVNQGYRCNAHEEQYLREEGKNYIADICSMPPMGQEKASTHYRKKY